MGYPFAQVRRRNRVRTASQFVEMRLEACSESVGPETGAIGIGRGGEPIRHPHPFGLLPGVY